MKNGAQRVPKRDPKWSPRRFRKEQIRMHNINVLLGASWEPLGLHFGSIVDRFFDDFWIDVLIIFQ